jgi:ubiquinone/menaquinone biosynthesis C-methylase UbiE
MSNSGSAGGGGSSTRTGIVIHDPDRYDLTVWLATFGREKALRAKLLRLARLLPGETMLDVGCGTGTLAVAAARRAGRAGQVTAVDVSPEMLARARRKADKARVRIDFREAPAQALPFQDSRFDLVTSTVMLHHVPAEARPGVVREMARVARPQGRVFIADFARSGGKQHGLIRHRHGATRPDAVLDLLAGAGLRVIDHGAVGLRDMQYALAERP